jgi:electron transfer flavoprotein beta subunit
MKIVVCAKQVPATESRLSLTADGRDITRSGLSFVVNPYDEFAVEEALQIKERLGTGDVTVLSLRPHTEQRPEEALRTCLAMGADRAILLSDPAFDGGDSLTAAVVLATAIRRMPFDLLLFGKQAVDDDGGTVGIQVAELLGIPHVAVVNKLNLAAGARSILAHRQIEGGIEVVEASLPALITCQKGLNEPRYPSLPGIMKAKQKPLEVWNRETVGLALEAVGAAGAKLNIVRLEPPPARPAGRMITGDAATAVKELVRLLHEEAKVI